MLKRILSWFRRNAYGMFAQRVLVALAMAGVSLTLSLLPHDTILQAIWVIVSALIMASLVLRERLNESDDIRYRRLFRSRFEYLQGNDPEALTTIFADNLRPRVYDWLRDEYGVNAIDIKHLDALDSLARNGDLPGQLLFRSGVELGRWMGDAGDPNVRSDRISKGVEAFIGDNKSLLGAQVLPGVFVRHIRRSEARPVGIHMFQPDSRLLLTIEYYDENSDRHSLALSAKSYLFSGDGSGSWAEFVTLTHEQFPTFQPAQGGSGPQKPAVPFFVGAIEETPPPTDADLVKRLTQLNKRLPQPTDSDAVP